jgi:isoleucyl-tRNA synthetase
MEDMRCSDEILQRVSDGYRKLRNTARFALGNLDGFEPERDAVADDQLMEIDRWALGELDAVIARVRAAYDAYEFHLVYQTLYEFCTVTLSARYFDIIKDRLYTFAPRNPARRSAQTALHRIADALAKMLAPILVFTSDEIWESLPAVKGRENSVHLGLLPDASAKYTDLRFPFALLFRARDIVLGKLEEARNAKLIGGSLEARVIISGGALTFRMLDAAKDDLRYIFIVSQVDVILVTIAEEEFMSVEIRRAEGQKCERCWNYSTHVGESEKYPTVCERCVAALEEIETSEQSA